MRVGIATDHGGLDLKRKLIDELRAAGHEIIDFGADDLNPEDDYPDTVIPLARAVAAESGPRDRDLRQRCRRFRVREQGAGRSRRVDSRPLLGLARSAGRSHERHLYGRSDGRTRRGLGPRPNVPDE